MKSFWKLSQRNETLSTLKAFSRSRFVEQNETWLKFKSETRRFYLIRAMAIFFIRGSLGWPFRELVFSDTSLWNQYKFITFNIFSCKILRISFKILIVTVNSNETANELTIYTKLCRNVTIFYRQEIASSFQVQEKIRACGNSKWSFSSSCFTACDSHLKIISSHTVVLNENAILCFFR